MSLPDSHNKGAHPSDAFDDSSCLDLSVIKQIWLVVHYEDCDPGSEFEIISDKQLDGDSWETLDRGVRVVVAFGNAKVQATVVTLSDDHQYLEDNFEAITWEFKERKVRSCLSGVAKNEPTEVVDKSTQTDVIDSSYEKLYLEMKFLYENSKEEVKKYKQLFKEVRGDLEGTMAKFNKVDQWVADKEKNNKRILKNCLNINTKLTASKQEVIKEEEGKGENDKNMVSLGPGKTKIPAHEFDLINWVNYSAATRKLLILLFPRTVLATHSLTGKPSPAFMSRDKEIKMRLNATIVGDIIYVVSKKCSVPESLVRNAITTKCADENKMYKKRLERKFNANI